ncbi:ABC transporter permease, partial [Duganella levis]
HADGGAWLRRALTALQFAAAIGMGSIALAILWQTQFAASASPGFDPAPLLTAELPVDINDPAGRAFRDALAQLPGVTGVADSSDLPGRDDHTGTHGSMTVKRNDGTDIGVSVHWIGASFFQVYGLQPLAGRLFDPRIDQAESKGEESVMLNQAAVRALGWPSARDAVGQRIYGTQTRIVGVAPDLRWETLRDPVQPIMYSLSTNSRLLTARVQGPTDAVEQAMLNTWQRYFPTRPPVIRHAASYHAQAYADDVRLAHLLACATAVVLVLAAFGIYVLAAHSVQRRAREIVLRKLHGAGRAAIAAL